MAKTNLSMANRHKLTGLLFVLPFILGFFFFFAFPMAQSIWFTFNKVTLEPGFFRLQWVGMDNIQYVLGKDPDYNKKLVSSLVQMAYQVPVVLIASLFFAIILNQKFKGRTFVRAIFFLPVIITSGVVMSIIKNDAFANSLIASANGIEAASASSAGLQTILIQIGLNQDIVNYFTTVSNNLFDLLWRTGIQMIIFVAALQTIPPSLYEASSIEGASAWENFWMITIPMISPMIFLNLIYTVIDSFTDSTNGVMKMVMDSSRSGSFANASSMGWIYFIIVAVILGIITFLYNWLSRIRD